MRRKLADATYDQEIHRMSDLPGFPHLPRAQQDLRRVMRRITEHDATFLHRLISEIVDGGERCPTPRELQEKASELRRRGAMNGGKPDCPECHGSGWMRTTKLVRVPGFDAYEAECSQRCACATAALKGE